MTIEVSDEIFNQLVRQHRDIPEDIIELIASNTERNNFIINDYLNNRAFYGKTIIFLDRWFQCLYVKNKLIENGIRTDAIFYQNNTDNQMRSGHNPSIPSRTSAIIRVLAALGSRSTYPTISNGDPSSYMNLRNPRGKPPAPAKRSRTLYLLLANAYTFPIYYYNILAF